MDYLEIASWVPCFHSPGQFKATWNESAQDILGKAQSPADWCRTFSLVRVQLGFLSIQIANVAPPNKLQITYLHVSCIMYQEEHEICRFWMRQLDVGLTPPLCLTKRQRRRLSRATSGMRTTVWETPDYSVLFAWCFWT